MPTTIEGKVERALELFNASDDSRTVSGLARSLGGPWVCALPDVEASSMVTVVVAWELSWYRYRIDLGDEHDPVALQDKGEEIDQIDSTHARVERRAGRARPFGGRGSPAMIYCVVPQALADDLYDRLADYYRDDPNVEVIVDRRAQGGTPGTPPVAQRSPASAAQGQLPADRTPVAELKVVVHVDGGSRGNPGPAAAGRGGLHARRRRPAGARRATSAR